MTRLIKICTGTLALAALVTGCSTLADWRDSANKENPAPCPNVIVLQDAGRMVQFSGEPALQNVAYTAEITNVQTTCRYYDDAPIEAAVEVNFAFGRGPQATASAMDVSYFVAVTRMDRDVIAKEEFTLPVRFRGDSATATLSDTVGSIVIPRKDSSTSGTNFEIVVGLALTREQVLYNRSGQSLKFPDLD